MNDRDKFVDKSLVCIDCGKKFQFSSGEQAYFASKNLLEPKRCLECRRQRKLALIISLQGRHDDEKK